MVIDRLDYNFVIGVAAMEGRGFYYPVDVAVAPDNKLFVLGRSHDGDTRGVQVLMCDIESEYYGVFASHGAEDGQFIWPTSISISGDGLIYVTDEHLNRVSVFDLDGKLVDRPVTLSKIKSGQADKGKYDHFMQKERLLQSSC